MIEAIGWSGSFLFAICAAPQAYKSYKEGHSKGLSSSYLILWLLALIFMSVYVIGKYGFDLPLIFNYLINFLFLLIILKFKFLERNEHKIF